MSEPAPHGPRGSKPPGPPAQGPIPDGAGALGPASLHAPWRLQYLEDLDANERTAGPPARDDIAFLRRYWETPEDDASNHVVARSDRGMILLNAYPYTSGHLLVAMGEGRPRLLDYAPAQRAELWRLVDVAADLLERTLQPQGINIGVNQGRAAGAGVPQHLHAHLVPRWGGDTNFMQTVGQVRVIPASIDRMYERFAATWATMGAG
ncbi:MAG: HIT domain-containing protein [Planctomycetota bacterium]